MIGIIVTGHGTFGSGLSGSLNLIAGEASAYHYQDFLEGMGADELEVALKEKIDDLLKECEGVMILSDLVGGSPFKTAVTLSINYPNVRVIGGTNLPMLLEVNGARQFMEDIDMLCDMGVNTGKDQVVKFDMASLKRHQDQDNDGEGI